jgi:hypothetical protein
MFTDNPFIPLATYFSPAFLQGYVVLMILAVILGTAYDLLHDGKAKFFFQERQRLRADAARPLSAAEKASVATRTVLTDIATFGEFSNPHRRFSHVLMYYGFVLYLLTTVVMIFAYPADPATPALLPILWNIGAVMTLAGGYWFFTCMRVNVEHDGQPPWRLVRADLFIVLLLTSVSLALLFEIAQVLGGDAAVRILAGLYLLFTTLLFVTVPWSKFAHMFYKPVVAIQKRLDEASGASDLPAGHMRGREDWRA